MLDRTSFLEEILSQKYHDLYMALRLLDSKVPEDKKSKILRLLVEGRGPIFVKEPTEPGYYFRHCYSGDIFSCELIEVFDTLGGVKQPELVALSVGHPSYYVVSHLVNDNTRFVRVFPPQDDQLVKELGLS